MVGRAPPPSCPSPGRPRGILFPAPFPELHRLESRRLHSLWARMQLCLHPRQSHLKCQSRRMQHPLRMEQTQGIGGKTGRAQAVAGNKMTCRDKWRGEKKESHLLPWSLREPNGAATARAGYSFDESVARVLCSHTFHRMARVGHKLGPVLTLASESFCSPRSAAACPAVPSFESACAANSLACRLWRSSAMHD